MKKIIFLMLSILFMNQFAFALVSTSIVKEDLNNVYNDLIGESKEIYEKYVDLLETRDGLLLTWDYKQLLLFTWVETDLLYEDVKQKYKWILQNLTSKKYYIISDLDSLENSFDSNLILTWEYESQIQTMISSVSWFNIDSKKDIELFQSKLSWYVEKFDEELENKLEGYSEHIEKYNNFNDQLSWLNFEYDQLKELNNKLENIIWLSKDLIDKKTVELKDYTYNYFSWYLNNEFEKLLKKNENMSYFEEKFENKKNIIMWFVNNKISGIMEELTKDYYPENVDVKSLEDFIKNLNNLSAKEITDEYSNLTDDIEEKIDIIKDYKSKIQEKLEKFDKSKNSKKILSVIKEDIINWIDETLPIVEKDLKSIFKNWKEFINKTFKEEEDIMRDILYEYNQNMVNWKLSELKDFKQKLEEYKSKIKMPKNLDKISKYKSLLNNKIDNVKFADLSNIMETLKKNVSNMRPWNNSQKIKSFKNSLEKLEEVEKFKDDIEDIRFKIELKQNLDDLYKAWAIRYFYEYWDLSDTVSNILLKYYNNYKEDWKKDRFKDKIDASVEKIEILNDTLANDKRSYYIIMIENGILKFQKEIE